MRPVTPWATEVFGLRIRHDGGAERIGDLVAPGLRRNPRRAHLLVSSVLGKHIAVSPDRVMAAGHRLGAAVAAGLAGQVEPVDVIGMAETATGLGHCVADRLDAQMYLHTTRRPAPGRGCYAEFREEHSHATDHSMQPSAAGLFDHDRTLVLVDDEISTGKTALAMIAELQRLRARRRYVVASLVDVRDDGQRAQVDAAAAELGTRVEFVSLARGRVDLPEGLVERVCALAPPDLNRDLGAAGEFGTVQIDWPAEVPVGGRHGFLAADRRAFADPLARAVDRIRATLDPGLAVLVVGHEELMYLPLRIAEALARNGFRVRYQTTTRSPAYVRDDPGYPLRRGWTFAPCEPGETAPRYLYNGWPAAEAGPVQLLLVLDEVAAAGDLEVAAVLAAAGHRVTVVRVNGPDIEALGAYRAGTR
ncbi:phosphoribosyltransferase family protein [Mycolicibacterium fallax]|uniref:Phosphoribosyltransferase n=1 Tax=Mycolicibacterium fallax TaxID=1793 RepID=A0A1X1R5J3_MYCFA|nr:phosphoribosyltransferase family protein [Mycolicibacterium fallax]ORV00003.1 phosphoribosyltransferase [Mycolicibacterium fallax]